MTGCTEYVKRLFPACRTEAVVYVPAQAFYPAAVGSEYRTTFAAGTAIQLLSIGKE